MVMSKSLSRSARFCTRSVYTAEKLTLLGGDIFLSPSAIATSDIIFSKGNIVALCADLHFEHRMSLLKGVEAEERLGNYILLAKKGPHSLDF